VASVLAACLLLTAAAQGAIFPDQFGVYQKSAPNTLVVPDRQLYDEYGLEATEQAEYTAPDKKHFSAIAWRMHDPTGALALFQFRRPPGAVSSDYAELAVRTSDGVIFTFGNYVLQITGDVPEPAETQLLLGQLPNVRSGALPAISSELPQDGLVPNSERYILGPVSLQRFEPQIPPSVAAFHLGSEAELGKYQTPKGMLTLTLFDYPTPSMARQQVTEFQKLAGAVVKRAGSRVAVILAPPDPDAAERILAKIDYQASVTLNEQTANSQAKGLASLILNIFFLAGVVLALCVLGGIGFGGYRIMSRKLWRKEDPYAMIVLDLERIPHPKE
jgi:hypothetical protein